MERRDSRRTSDLSFLDNALALELTESERQFVADVYEQMTDDARLDRQRYLSVKQRVAVQKIVERHVPQYENLVSSGRVPLGRPVETPAVLRPENLPKRPPPRRQSS